MKERKDLRVIVILVVPAPPAAKASDFIKHLLFYSIAYLVFSNSICKSSMHDRFLGDCSMLCKPFRFPLRNSRLDPYYNLVEVPAAKMIVLWLM